MKTNFYSELRIALARNDFHLMKLESDRVRNLESEKYHIAVSCQLTQDGFDLMHTVGKDFPTYFSQSELVAGMISHVLEYFDQRSSPNKIKTQQSKGTTVNKSHLAATLIEGAFSVRARFLDDDDEERSYLFKAFGSFSVGDLALVSTDSNQFKFGMVKITEVHNEMDIDVTRKQNHSWLFCRVTPEYMEAQKKIIKRETTIMRYLETLERDGTRQKVLDAYAESIDMDITALKAKVKLYTAKDE